MSRLIEVAGDLGIEAGTLETSLGKMNQTAGKSPAAFEAIGAEIVKTESGATDVNKTFLATVDALNRIEDPAKRAAAAQQIFGKSWRDSAELIGLGSEQIARAMANVSDAKIIDDDEVRKAREFREKLDELKDSVEDIQLAVGEYLVPALTDAAGAFMTVKDAAEDLGDILPDMPGWVDGLADSFEMVVNPLGAFSGQMEKLQNTIDPHAVGELGDSITDYTPAVEDATEATEDNTDAIDAMAEAAKRGTQQIKDAIAAYEKAEAAQRGMQSASLAYRQQVADTAAAVAESTLIQLDAKRTDEEREQAARDAEAAMLAQADAALALAEDQAAANGVTLTADERTKAYVEELYTLAATMSGPARAEIEAHIARLLNIPKSIYTNVGTIRGGDFSPVVSGRRASGGPTTPGGTYLVGEEGPELLQMGSQSGNVIPNGAIVGGAIGGNPTTVNVTVNGADPNMVIAAIRKYVRTNGPIRGIT
jgi:hypothetical protein